MKQEKKTIDVDVYYSDISQAKIPDYNEHFNKCVRCGKHFTDNECGYQEEDGALCELCSAEGYKFEYGDGVGIVDKEGKLVDAPYL